MSPRVNRGMCRRVFAAPASIAMVLLAALPARADGPLSFFKNYFVAGDHVVRGVSLWRKGVDGKAVADIPALGGPGGVPPAADLVAAFLYVETAESVEGTGIDHATFDGIDLGPYTAAGSSVPGSGTYAKPLVPWLTAPAPCWGIGFARGRRVMTYRVDVLRFLPVDPATGKQDLSSSHRITVPDRGSQLPDLDETGVEADSPWSAAPRAMGAALLVVYRDPDPAGKPFSAIVVYDGTYTKRSSTTMSQAIQGFYQASNQSPSAKMTHIAASSRSVLSEQVSLDGMKLPKYPFIEAEGPKWDNPTFTGLPLAGGAATTTVTVNPSSCLTFGAIVFQTTVQDTDGDGLIDAWEKEPPPYDPSGVQLPDLAAMGADANRRDLFVQIDYLYAAEGVQYGGAPKPAHTHLPTAEALKQMGDAFAARGVQVHFDVGNNYQGQPYVIPSALARGGHSISETRACADPANPVTGDPVECATFDANGAVAAQADLPGQFPRYPGTVGWKTGFQLMRDELLGFDRNRKDIFRYALFAHALGIPVEPCVDGSTGLVDHECQDTNASFHVPRTNSGIGDFPGGDLLVALGAFDDSNRKPSGTPYMQGSTLMHELGHTFELTHAGFAPWNQPREPNCKPHYLSVMNYLYQLRGLQDDAGKLHMDYSAVALPGMNEGALSDGAVDRAPDGGLLTPYRFGYYAPVAGSYLEDLVTQGRAKVATKHCNGTDRLPGEPDMVRVDAPTAGFIDWNANGLADGTASAEDVNFDGTPEMLGPSANDWVTLRLNQIGSRRSPGGYYVDARNGTTRYAVGPLSLDVGRGDIGRGDIGRGDIGRGDIGRGDIGRGDIGRGDIGRGDIGRGDIGRGDIGRGDIGRGDIGRGDIGRGDIGRGDIGRGELGLGDLDVGGPGDPVGDLDLPTAVAVSGNAAGTPPTQVTTCLTVNGACAAGGDRPVRVDWSAPSLGAPVAYAIFRFEVVAGAPFPPALPTEPIATVLRPSPGAAPPTSYVDGAAPADRTLAYYVVADFGEGAGTSGISNFAIVTTPPDRAKLMVWGQDMSGLWQNVRVATEAGQPVDGASVTVNGTNIPGTGDGWYSGVLPSLVPAGGAVSLVVEFGGFQVDASSTVPAAPILSQPGNGDVVDPSQDILVTWALPAGSVNPERFVVTVQWPCGPNAGCSIGDRYTVGGDARAAVVLAADLIAFGAGDVTIQVFAYDGNAPGTFSGSYKENSLYPGMNIRAQSAPALVVRYPPVQARIDYSVGNLALGGSNSQKLAQTFTVDAGQTIYGFFVAALCSAGADVVAEIQETTGGVPNGTTLASQLIAHAGTAYPPLPGTPSLREYSGVLFDVPVHVTTSGQLALVLSVTDPANPCAVHQAPPGDLYTGGAGYFDARPNPPGWVQFSGNGDLPFEVRMTPPQF